MSRTPGTIQDDIDDLNLQISELESELRIAEDHEFERGFDDVIADDDWGRSQDVNHELIPTGIRRKR